MAMLGWCMTGFHEGRELKGPGVNCPGVKGNLTCSCSCHGGTDAETTGLRTPDDALDRRALPVP